MKIIKRLCSAVLSSAILLTSADLSAFAVHSVKVLPNVSAEDDSIIAESNEYLPFIDENDIGKCDNPISEINDIFKPDTSDDKIIFDPANNFSEHNDSKDKNFSEDAFVYEEEILIAPNDEFVYEEEILDAPNDEFIYEEEILDVPNDEFVYEEEILDAPNGEFAYEEEILNAPEESETTDNSGETDSIDDTTVSDGQEDTDEITDELIYIEDSPIDLSEFDFDEVVKDDYQITESITISGKTVLYEGNLTIDENVTLRTCPHRLKSAKKSMQI